MIAWIEKWLASRSNNEAVTHSVLTLGVIGFLDYVTGPEIGFSIFYVMPVFAITWRLGIVAGMGLSGASAIVWSFVDFLGRPEMSRWTAVWNVFVGFILLVLFTYLVSRIKKDIVRLIETTGALEKALAEVKRLTGLMRMCAWCRRIKNDEGEWEPLDLYVRKHSDVNFTHGICPDCVKEHYPNVNLSG